MAPVRKRTDRSLDRILDYKTAFYGACGLVTVFAGLSWRLFTADLDDTNKSRTATDQDQWAAIRTIERQLDAASRDVAICYKDGTALEARIQYLERQEHKHERQ